MILYKETLSSIEQTMALPLIGKKDRTSHRKSHKESKELTATVLSNLSEAYCPVVTVKD